MNDTGLFLRQGDAVSVRPINILTPEANGDVFGGRGRGTTNMLKCVSEMRKLVLEKTHKIINSTMLPNVTFNSAPRVSPSRYYDNSQNQPLFSPQGFELSYCLARLCEVLKTLTATLSVASESSPAKGMIAIAFITKMTVGSTLA